MTTSTTTPKASTKRSKRYTYAKLMAQASKPMEKRSMLPIGRGGTDAKVRCFHLLDSDVEQLAAAHKDGDKLPNPHNKGNYFYLIEAGKTLGLNRAHSQKDFIGAVRELMQATTTKDGEGQTAWQRFIHKETRNEETGIADAAGRIMQNLTVLQRVNTDSLTPYGLKLLQVGTKVLKTKGCVFNIYQSKAGEISIELATDSATPLNEMKRVRSTVAAPKAKASKPKAKKVAKAAKATKVVAKAHPTSPKKAHPTTPAQIAAPAVETKVDQSPATTVKAHGDKTVAAAPSEPATPITVG